MGAKDKFQATPASINPTDFDYGGGVGAAALTEASDNAQAQQAANVAAPTLNFDPSNASLGAATGDLNLGQQALGTIGQYNATAQNNLAQQQSNVNALTGLAGTTTLDPSSLSAQQIQQNLNQSNAEASSAAQSAQGGGAASALANRAAIMQSAQNAQNAGMTSATLGQQQQIASQNQLNSALTQYGSSNTALAGANQGYAAGQATAAAANQATASQQAAQQTSAASNAQAQQQLNNQNAQFYSNQAQTVASEQLNANQGYASLASGNQNASQSLNASVAAANTASKNALVNGIIGSVGSAASDVRVKDNVASEDGADLSLGHAARDAAPAQMMDKLDPYSWTYKAGYGSPGRRYGVMAQDLEKTPMGASMVVDTPRGKMIEQSAAQSASLAALANLHDRVSYLEDDKKGRR